jgi:small subunit ribosomal protein S3
MGQKIRPTGFRIGVTEDWRSRWYAHKKDYGTFLVEDQKIRKYVKDTYGYAGIPRIDIERKPGEVCVIIRAQKPGVIIGRKGANIDKLKDELSKLVGKTVDLRIVEIDRPELDAQLVAESIGDQLKKRMSFRRVLKKTTEVTMNAGAKGCKIQVSGRLGGHEMARTESEIVGSIPLHTLRADIDYGFAEANTTHGIIGCKVWIFTKMLKPGEKKRYGSIQPQQPAEAAS